MIDIINNLKRTSMSNITERGRKAIASLVNDDTIIICPAEKGTAVVVMHTNDYIQGLEEDLKNDNTYKQVSKDNTTITKQNDGSSKKVYLATV